MKRAYFLLVCFLLAAAFRAPAQSLAAKDLIGTWRVMEVSAAPGQYSAAEKKKMAEFKDAFLQAVFRFKEGNHFSFEFGPSEISIDDGFWKLDGDAVEVREWKDKSSLLMKILIKKNGGATTFAIDETPFILKVNKY
jgi:hypothetical protein